VGVKLDEDNLKILDELPNSAVEMQVKDKVRRNSGVIHNGVNKFYFQFLKKLNRQERVVEEVKLVLKPHYNKKHINKEEYKDILRRAVPKVL
jgi:PHD and RING finger domain-containing protein 1